MEQTILTAAQRKALEQYLMRSDLASLFYLTGGTALAEFYLKHRVSDDLDFFTDSKDFPQFSVERFAQDLKGFLAMDTLEYRRIHDRRIFLFRKGDEELKVEFTHYPFRQIETPVIHEGIPVDSLKDIAANKLTALFDRIEPKDFVDLYFLLTEHHLTLSELRGLVEQKFGFRIDDVALGSEFAKVRHVTFLPKMLKPLTIEQLKAFFTEQAKALGGTILGES